MLNLDIVVRRSCRLWAYAWRRPILGRNSRRWECTVVRQHQVSLQLLSIVTRGFVGEAPLFTDTQLNITHTQLRNRWKNRENTHTSANA